jgi:glycosyltransferase involved in cell wall biosynthesis
MISIVCPFYNEAEVVPVFFTRLVPIMRDVGEAFEVVCVNDGSVDGTLERLLEAQYGDDRIRVMDLSRNFGKEAALTAGLDAAKGDAAIVIDADLQDPPEVIPEMIAAWRDGYEVVVGCRADRSEDSVGKRVTARLFYRVQNMMSEVPIPENVGDFRLLDRKVIDAMKRFPERRRFMKGLFAWVGFKTQTVRYKRERRCQGKSKWGGWGLWNFALEGITSFSTAPLRVWTYLGLAVAGAAFVYALFIVWRTLMYGVDVPGYASLLTVVLFLGGIQLIGLGVLGEYLGRVYLESKQRPVYVVRKVYG